jgi:uncharacterized membrane protein
MSKTRLEAFSDGVIAILITIMVLELKVPHGDDWAALRALAPTLGTYALSFVYVGIYWNNHHHMLHLSRRVTGRVLWSNLHLLFWISLIPFLTNWWSESGFARLPTALYGVVLFASGVSYRILQKAIIAADGPDSPLKAAVGNVLKERISTVLYAAAIGVAFVQPLVSGAIYVVVALVWVVPDRRIERQLHE